MLTAYPVAARLPSWALVKGGSHRPLPWASRTWPRTPVWSGPRADLRHVDLREELRLLVSTDTDSHVWFGCLLVGQPLAQGPGSAGWPGLGRWVWGATR